MKLELDVNGTQRHIEILESGPGCRFRLDGGVERSAGIEMAEPCVYSVLMDGRSYEARVEERPEGLVVVIDGNRFEIAVRDPRRRSRRAASTGAGGAQAVTSPMPGKVVRVLVAVGDVVQAGQGLVVVEAMKMQNEMKAPSDGTVLTVAAKEGATVAAGEVLATIG
jgi:biotin carboxyl carrier protein